MALFSRARDRFAREGFRVTTPRRFYSGRALSHDVSRAVSIVSGGAALLALFALYLWACSLGLPNL